MLSFCRICFKFLSTWSCPRDVRVDVLSDAAIAAVAAAAMPTETLSSPLTVFTTAVNFVLGAGVLGLPYAMASAGLLASVLSLVVVAFFSILTCSWLLEVGDRANALQNEMAQTKRVAHADGGTSVLPPAAAFCARRKQGILSEPLLERGERKLDEYRAAYRSWRQGSHQGARDSQLKKLMPLLVYQPRKHRELLPLQLLPPPRSYSHEEPEEDEEEEGTLAGEPNWLQGLEAQSRQLNAQSALSSANNSSQSLDNHRGSALMRPRKQIVRTNSFSVDLANALMALPAHYTADWDDDEPEDEPYVAYESICDSQFAAVEPPQAQEVVGGGYAPPPMESSRTVPLPPPPAVTPTSSTPNVRTPGSGTPNANTPPLTATPPARRSEVGFRVSPPGRRPPPNSSVNLEDATRRGVPVPRAAKPDWSVPEEISALEVRYADYPRVWEGLGER